jgi:acetyl-CoA synthetase
MYRTKVPFAQLAADFRWENELACFSRDISQGFNFTEEACHRYADSARIAIRWVGASGTARDISHAELGERADRVANLLWELGIRPGDRVATLMPRVPELYASLLGIWKIGAVYVPLFTAFGPEANTYRLQHSQTRLVFTHGAFRHHIEANISGLEHTVVVHREGSPSGDVDFHDAMSSCTGKADTAVVYPDDLAVLLYTSGSTGLPKGAMLSYKFFIFHVPYVRYALGLQPEDAFWCAADPAWAYGLLAALVPLTLGNTLLVHEGVFQPELCYQLLAKYEVTHFAYVPTAFRMLAAAGKALRRQYEVRLRSLSSCGEPLNAEIVRWSVENFGTPIHDHYGFTEGGMLINNYNVCDMEIRPGSMGRPVPWQRVVLLDAAGCVGDGKEPQRIAVSRTEYGAYFQGYWQAPEQTTRACLGDWFLPGDLARRDEGGYLWFAGRADDVIISAGLRIGPFEVESVLVAHEAVQEAAVVGKPDALKGEIIKAYVVLGAGYAPSAALGEALKGFVRRALSRHEYPREVDFVNELPKTASGKIQRFKLREQARREYTSTLSGT